MLPPSQDRLGCGKLENTVDNELTERISDLDPLRESTGRWQHEIKGNLPFVKFHKISSPLRKKSTVLEMLGHLYRKTQL